MWAELQQRLKDPDQWVRVEALRIVAMVEEIRALGDIERIFKTDPEPGVRQVAQWAGRLVYAAYKQQKRSTEQLAAATESAENAHEERLIAGMIDKGSTYQMMQDQLLQRELQDTMKKGSTLQPAPTIVPMLEPRRDANYRRPITDVNELLDAGLSEDFFK